MCAVTRRKNKRKQSLDPGDPPYQGDPFLGQHCRLELDSHADTSAFGSTCLVLQETGRTVNVEGFGEVLGQLTNVPIVTCAVAYDCPATYTTYILIFHESLHIPSMTTHLVNTWQMRAQGIVVNDVPLQHLPPEERHQQCHSLLHPETGLHIPLELNGIMSGFVVRLPTWEEIQDVEQQNVTHVHMTSNEPWSPTHSQYSKIEGTLRDTVSRGMDLIEREDRDISQLQVRGQVDEAPVTLDDGSTFGLHSSAATLTLKSLQQEQCHHAALEVDRYAQALMFEYGIADKDLSELGQHIAAAKTIKKKHGFVDAQQLARNWKIGLEAAKRTVEATTQLAVRDFTHTTGGRRLKPSHWVLNQARLDCQVYTDTLIARCRSLRGNKVAQVFATFFHFVRVFPMESKRDAHYSLDDFFREVGIPQVLIPDNAKELTQGEFRKKCRRAQCPIHPVEAFSPNHNLTESVIRELKRHYRRVMIETGAPEVLWDYCLEHCALIRSHTALNIHQLNGRTPATMMTGDTSDISFIAEFGWYDWVWYVDEPGRPSQDGTGQPSMQRKRLGRYLGPSINVGDAMCGIVLTERGTRLDRTSIIPLSVEDKNSDPVKKRKEVFEKVLAEKLKDRIKAMDDGKSAAALDQQEHDWVDEYTPEYVSYEQFSPAELGIDLPDDGREELPELADADDLDLNKYISAKVMLPRGGHTFASGRVLKRARDQNGELIGKENSNPLLDSSVYEVEFEDGTVERYHANIIAEHIYSQIDGDGYGRTLLDEIIDHRRDDTAIDAADGFVPGPNGSKVPKQTTRGWWLLVRLKDHTTEWYKLKDMKESNPLEVAQYAIDNKLED